MNRRLLVIAMAGAVPLGLLAVSTSTAGAATPRHAVTPRHARATASITLSQYANIKGGQVLTVAGKGFPAGGSLAIAECNGDGYGPGALAGSCDLAKLGSATASSSGTFSSSFTVVSGNMSSKAYTGCPAGAAEAAHSVTCFIAVADLKAGTFAYRAFFFQPPALQLTYAKSTVVDGRQTYRVTITEGVGFKNGLGGYFDLGWVQTSKGRNYVCQASLNNSTVWTGSISLHSPACNVHEGELADISWTNVFAGQIRVGVRLPGAFSYVIAHARAGDHAIKVVGLASGQTLTATADVP